jgi:hypothetical protein
VDTRGGRSEGRLTNEETGMDGRGEVGRGEAGDDK